MKKKKARGSRHATLTPAKLPRSWCWATLADVKSSEPNAITDGPFGSKLKTSHYTDSGPRVVRLQNIGDGVFKDAEAHISDAHFADLPKHRVFAGDLVIAALGENLPRACVIPASLGDAIVKADCIRFKPDARLASSEYLSYALNSDPTRKRTAAIIHGVGRPRLNLAEVRSISVPLAPINEQRRIIAKLDELFSDLDAGTVRLNRAKANLKRYRAGVLKAAVDASLTAQWRAAHPASETGSQVLERILAERRRHWEAEQLAKFRVAEKTPPKHWRDNYVEPEPPDTSDLPELPKEWCWAAVDQLGNAQLGRQRSPRNRSKDHPTKYLRAANLTERGIDLSDVLDMEFMPGEREIYRLAKGDILLSEASGSPDQVGKPVVWNDELEDCCFQNTVIRLRPTLPISAYLLVAFQHCYFNNVFAKHATGVGINHLSAARFARIPIPIPPQEEQCEIVACVQEGLDAVIEGNRTTANALRRASNLRRAILGVAFEGKLVPQDPSDEPAPVFLDRIRQERAAKAEVEKGERKSGKRKGAKNMSNHERRPLLDVLGEHPKGLTPEDLLRAAGYAITEVDDFYSELRGIAGQVEEKRPAGAKINKWPKGAKIMLRAKGE